MNGFGTNFPFNGSIYGETLQEGRSVLAPIAEWFHVGQYLAKQPSHFFSPRSEKKNNKNDSQEQYLNDAHRATLAHCFPSKPTSFLLFHLFVLFMHYFYFFLLHKGPAPVPGTTPEIQWSCKLLYCIPENKRSSWASDFP